MANKKTAEPSAAEKAEATKWQTRIGFAREFRETDGRKEAWKNMKAYYRNQFAKDVVSVPLLYAHGGRAWGKRWEPETPPVQKWWALPGAAGRSG